MLKNFSCAVCLLLITLSVYASSSFQEVAADTPFHELDSMAVRDLTEVTVTGLLANKLNFPYLETSGDEALDNGNITAGDLLDDLPGVAVHRDSPWATTVTIRGFDESKLLFLSDGDRMLTATDVAGTLSTVDLGSIEKVEVIKGAGSVIYGSGAMGGAVNFVLKRPDYTEHFNSHGRATTAFHTVNNLWENSLNVDFSDENWYLVVDGSYRQAANTMTPQGVQENSQFNDASWGVRGGMRNGDKQELLVGYNHFEAWNVGLPGGSAFPPNALVRYLSFKRNQLNGEYRFYDLNDYIKTLSIKAYTQNINREVENIANEKMAIYPVSLNTTSGVKAVADLYFNDYETMMVGVDGWVRDQATRRLKFNAVGADTIITQEQPTPKAAVLDVGVFAQHQWIIDPKYWTLSTGVRLDFIRTTNDTAFNAIAQYKYDEYGQKVNLPFTPQVRFPMGEKNEFAYAAHIDLSYKPLEGHKFVLSLANAYRVASLEERFKYIDQSGDPLIGNPDLKPEKGLFSNLSYSLIKHKLTLQADIFSNYIFDLIAERKDDNYRDINNQIIKAWVNTNIDRALLAGGELDIHWLLIPSLHMEANFAYVYGLDINTKQELPLLPPLHGEIGLHYDWTNKFTSFIETVFDYQLSKTFDDTQYARSFIVFNAGFHTRSIKFNDILQLQFLGGIQNILNTAYKEYMAAARGINQLEPGRSLFLRAKLEW